LTALEERTARSLALPPSRTTATRQANQRDHTPQACILRRTEPITTQAGCCDGCMRTECTQPLRLARHPALSNLQLVGVNVEGVADYSHTWTFLDVMKIGRSWFTFVSGPGGIRPCVCLPACPPCLPASLLGHACLPLATPRACSTPHRCPQCLPAMPASSPLAPQDFDYAWSQFVPLPADKMTDTGYPSELGLVNPKDGRKLRVAGTLIARDLKVGSRVRSGERGVGSGTTQVVACAGSGIGRHPSPISSQLNRGQEAASCGHGEAEVPLM